MTKDIRMMMNQDRHSQSISGKRHQVPQNLSFLHTMIGRKNRLMLVNLLLLDKAEAFPGLRERLKKILTRISIKLRCFHAAQNVELMPFLLR